MPPHFFTLLICQSIHAMFGLAAIICVLLNHSIAVVKRCILFSFAVLMLYQILYRPARRALPVAILLHRCHHHLPLSALVFFSGGVSRPNIKSAAHVWIGRGTVRRQQHCPVALQRSGLVLHMPEISLCTPHIWRLPCQ